MKTFAYTIKDELGIHARPAGMLVKEAAKYACAIKLCKEEKTADAKRIFSVMALAVKYGDTVQIECDGPDEEVAADSLRTFLSENL